MKKVKMETLTNQEIFNIIWKRAKNKNRAADDDSDCCRMRLGNVPEGLPCFVGALIPNDLYWPECNSISQIRAGQPQLAHLLGLDEAEYEDERFSFLAGLMKIHDNKPTNEWEKHLRKFASDHKLTIPGENNEATTPL